MSNSLVKWNPANRQKIETALALSGAKSLIRPPEILELLCMCADRDKPYTLRFTRSASGLFTCSGSIKVEGDGNRGRGGAVISLRADRFDDSETPCAWCGALGFALCSCKAFVCLGRMAGRVFHCRSSCGLSWEGVPLTKLNMKKAAKPQVMQAPPRAKPVRMITAGSNPGRYDFVE